jgi:hypothetical protein
MSQVIMIFLFPIGFYFYFFVERKNRHEYQQTFDDFQKKISQSRKLSQEEKLEHFQAMLINNDYKICKETLDSIEGEKKIFSMSLFTMTLGIFFVGAVFYLLYFYYIQEPHTMVYKIY